MIIIYYFIQFYFELIFKTQVLLYLKTVKLDKYISF